MRKILLLLLFALLTVLSFSNCKLDTDLQGSVFIVTQGAENYKLGLVKIVALPESEITNFVEQKKKSVRDSVSGLNGQVSSLKPEIQMAQQRFDEAKLNFDSINSQRGNLKKIEESLNIEFNPYALDVSSFMKQYETQEQIAERIKQRQIEKQLNGIRRQLASYDAKLSHLGRAKTDAEIQLRNLNSKLSEILDKLKSFINPSFLFDGMPEGNLKAITDAEGKFTFKLPKGRYAILAASQRRVYANTEEYHWLVWADVDGGEPKNIILSNHNLLGQDSEDSIFKISELAPILGNPQAEPKSDLFKT